MTTTSTPTINRPARLTELRDRLAVIERAMNVAEERDDQAEWLRLERRSERVEALYRAARADAAEDAL